MNYSIHEQANGRIFKVGLYWEAADCTLPMAKNNQTCVMYPKSPITFAFSCSEAALRAIKLY